MKVLYDCIHELTQQILTTKCEIQIVYLKYTAHLSENIMTSHCQNPEYK